jgi:hypothetical protein
MSETPPVILSQKLAEARTRGENWESAWPVALEAALGGNLLTSRECGDWRTAFEDQIDVWSAAYERRPGSRPELALHRLEEPAGVKAQALVEG